MFRLSLYYVLFVYIQQSVEALKQAARTFKLTLDGLPPQHPLNVPDSVEKKRKLLKTINEILDTQSWTTELYIKYYGKYSKKVKWWNENKDEMAQIYLKNLRKTTSNLEKLVYSKETVIAAQLAYQQQQQMIQQQQQQQQQQETEEQRIQRLRLEKRGKEKEEQERLAEDEEKKRKEKERLERIRKEEERKQREEKERLERLEKERLERLEKERLERLEKERLERLEKERLERLEKERLERLEKERLERLEKERLERMETERLERLAQQMHLTTEATTMDNLDHVMGFPSGHLPTTSPPLNQYQNINPFGSYDMTNVPIMHQNIITLTNDDSSDMSSITNKRRRQKPGNRPNKRARVDGDSNDLG